jgi:hypothetical protein
MAFGQAKNPGDVSLDALLTDTQYSSDNQDYLEMVWWLPTVFWEVSFAQDPSTSKADGQAVIDLFQGYELFAVVKGEIGAFGGITYTTLDDIKGMLSVTYEGQKLTMVDDKDISPDLTNFLLIIRPMMSNMLGSMGENLHFIFVEHSAKNTVLPIDPLSSSSLEIELEAFKPAISLPLNSLLLEKQCPVDEKWHSGKWSYCPFHGSELKSN